MVGVFEGMSTTVTVAEGVMAGVSVLQDAVINARIINK
jgi:hypothetical protein